jgi:hemerythrin-like domain-containing protein
VKRDHRLRALSSEHHHALVLARSVGRRASTWSAEAGAELARTFADELAPHFAVEEDILLPALREVGADGLVERTREDHAALRVLALDAEQGDGEAAATFAARLTAHVRFEERELFPACEELLSADVLDRVAARGPSSRTAW